jgi:hypothetical protein
MQKFTAHQVKVGRAILSTLFAVPTTRTRLECDNYLYVTTDHEPRDAAYMAIDGDWEEVPTSQNAKHFQHADYPGALLEVTFDEMGTRRSLCSLMLRDVESAPSIIKRGKPDIDYDDCIVTRRLPKFLESGIFYTENFEVHADRKRIIRVMGEYRTHNIDLRGNCLLWENTNSEEYCFAFESKEMAQQWWDATFDKCRDFWKLPNVMQIKSR